MGTLTPHMRTLLPMQLQGAGIWTWDVRQASHACMPAKRCLEQMPIPGALRFVIADAATCCAWAAPDSAACVQVRLVRPGSWTTAWTHQLERGELATAVVSVQLRDQDKPDGLLQASPDAGVSARGLQASCSKYKLLRTGTGGGGHLPGMGRGLPLPGPPAACAH